MQGAWIWSLMRELRSCMPLGKKKKKKKLKKLQKEERKKIVICLCILFEYHSDALYVNKNALD